MVRINALAVIASLILFGSIAINQDAFASEYWLPKAEKQTAAAFFVGGFVVLYGLLIYVDKSERIGSLEKKITKDQYL